mmetsp:Transcript_44340/g.105629  ORF Transcript_44340/g.105629 Transcript_44340/m.105629 type:complete len:214 (+) Transcript_44340:213-854(+)
MGMTAPRSDAGSTCGFRPSERSGAAACAKLFPGMEMAEDSCCSLEDPPEPKAPSCSMRSSRAERACSCRRVSSDPGSSPSVYMRSPFGTIWAPSRLWLRIPRTPPDIIIAAESTEPLEVLPEPLELLAASADARACSPRSPPGTERGADVPKLAARFAEVVDREISDAMFWRKKMNSESGPDETSTLALLSSPQSSLASTCSMRTSATRRSSR